MNHMEHHHWQMAPNPGGIGVLVRTCTVCGVEEVRVSRGMYAMWRDGVELGRYGVSQKLPARCARRGQKAEP